MCHNASIQAAMVDNANASTANTVMAHQQHQSSVFPTPSNQPQQFTSAIAAVHHFPNSFFAGPNFGFHPSHHHQPTTGFGSLHNQSMVNGSNGQQGQVGSLIPLSAAAAAIAAASARGSPFKQPSHEHLGMGRGHQHPNNQSLSPLLRADQLLSQHHNSLVTSTPATAAALLSPSTIIPTTSRSLFDLSNHVMATPSSSLTSSNLLAANEHQDRNETYQQHLSSHRQRSRHHHQSHHHHVRNQMAENQQQRSVRPSSVNSSKQLRTLEISRTASIPVESADVAMEVELASSGSLQRTPVNNASQPQVTCQVCYLAASNGLHFGARTCAACAAFFRRSISDQKRYICKRSQRCVVRPGEAQGYRKMCRNCRMKRCLEIGMLPENVQNKRHRREFYFPVDGLDQEQQAAGMGAHASPFQSVITRQRAQTEVEMESETSKIENSGESEGIQPPNTDGSAIHLEQHYSNNKVGCKLEEDDEDESKTEVDVEPKPSQTNGPITLVNGPMNTEIRALSSALDEQARSNENTTLSGGLEINEHFIVNTHNNPTAAQVGGGLDNGSTITHPWFLAQLPFSRNI